MSEAKQALPISQIKLEGYRNPLMEAFSQLPTIQEISDKKIEERLNELENKMDEILRKLDLIFGKSVLLKGRFVDL